VLRAVEPTGPGVRVDTGVTTGAEISLHYDPMIAKLIVLGENRQEAITKMDWALRHYLILGVATNIPFLKDLIAHSTFSRGEATTQFVEQHFAQWQPAYASPPDLAFVAAALSDLLAEQQGTAVQLNSDTGDVFSPWTQLKGFRLATGQR